MILFEKELQDLPGMNPDLDPDQGEELSCSITVTREQIEHIKQDFNIDVEAMVQDALIQETHHQIARAVSKACFNNREIQMEYRYLKEVFLNTLKRGYGFLLTNVKLGTLFQDLEDFESMPLNKGFHSPASIYQLGSLYEYKVFVDPMLRYDEDQIAVVTNNFYNFKQEKGLKLVLEGSMAPKTVTTIMLNMKKAKTKVIKVNNAQI